MERYNQDHALSDYFKNHSVSIDKALLLLKEGYEPQEIVRILKKVDIIERKEPEEVDIDNTNIVSNQLLKRNQQNKDRFGRFSKKGYLLAMTRDYGATKLGILTAGRRSIKQSSWINSGGQFIHCSNY